MGSMLTAVIVVLLAAAAGACGSLLVARAAPGRSRWVRRTLATLTALALAAAAVFGWSALMVDRSAVGARGRVAQR